jgi:hypothetical protein
MEKDVKTTVQAQHYEDAYNDITPIKRPAAMGTVQINDSQDIVLVPAPSADPRGNIYPTPAGQHALTRNRPVEHADLEETPVCDTSVNLYGTRFNQWTLLTHRSL